MASRSRPDHDSRPIRAGRLGMARNSRDWSWLVGKGISTSPGPDEERQIGVTRDLSGLCSAPSPFDSKDAAEFLKQRVFDALSGKIVISKNVTYDDLRDVMITDYTNNGQKSLGDLKTTRLPRLDAAFGAPTPLTLRPRRCAHSPVLRSLARCVHSGGHQGIPHDFRKTAVRHLERAGVPRGDCHE